MTTREEFLEREILPTLGEYAGDYDVDAICDEVSAWDPYDGYVWAPNYDDDPEAYWGVVQAHEIG